MNFDAKRSEKALLTLQKGIALATELEIDEIPSRKREQRIKTEEKWSKTTKTEQILDMEQEYYHTKESVEEYIRLAKDVSGKELIDKLMPLLPPQSSVLEIGSGPGTDWKILNESYNVVGSDNSAEFVNHLVGSNPKGEFLELDAVTLTTDKSFDGIYANKVMHHLTDEELASSAKRQHELLNAGGVICLSFWKGDGSEVFKGMFVNYHTEEEIKAIFSSLFEIVLLELYAEFEDGDSILLIAKKK